MSALVVFAILGIGTGALYGALAVGSIIVYRAGGVINFALGAMAMFPAVVYAELRTSGDLLLPLILVPDRIDIGGPMPFVPAALIGLATGLVIAAVAHRLIFRPLRDHPPVTLIVATIGLTVVLQGLAVRSFGPASVRTPKILPQQVVMIFGRTVPTDRLWLLAIVVVLVGGLSLLYRHSRFGLATRAAALNEKGATLLGFHTGRLGAFNWFIAAVLVGSVGILSTSISGVDPFNYSFFVVPGLSAALAARLSSFPIAMATGVAIGGFEAVTVHLVAQRWVPAFFRGGFSSLGPFLVIVVALVVVGRTLPNRGSILELRQVKVQTSRARPQLWVGATGVAAAAVWFGDATVRLATIQTMFVAVLLLSMVILTGLIGQVSLAQLAFAGFSAFVLSKLDALPFPLAPLVAVGVTVMVGLLVSVPAIRIRGVQLAIVTFAAAFVVEQVLFRSPTFVGTGGLADIAEPRLFGLDLGIIGDGRFPQRSFGLLTLALLLGCAGLTAAVARGPVGRRFLAVRINERAAAAAGINVPRTKLLASALSSGVAAVAGVIFAYKSVSFTGAGLEASQGLEFFALAYVGGIGSVTGAVIGGLLAPSGLFIVAIASAEPSINQFLLTGLALVVVAVRIPGGLAGLFHLQPHVLTVQTDSDSRAAGPHPYNLLTNYPERNIES